MKEKELREAATCEVCGKKFGEAGLPMFYRVRIQHYCLNAAAIQRQQGLGMMVGSPALAMAMGTDEDLAEMLSEKEITVCATCANHEISIGELAEGKG